MKTRHIILPFLMFMACNPQHPSDPAHQFFRDIAGKSVAWSHLGKVYVTDYYADDSPEFVSIYPDGSCEKGQRLLIDNQACFQIFNDIPNKKWETSCFDVTTNFGKYTLTYGADKTDFIRQETTSDKPLTCENPR